MYKTAFHHHHNNKNPTLMKFSDEDLNPGVLNTKYIVGGRGAPSSLTIFPTDCQDRIWMCVCVCEGGRGGLITAGGYRRGRR